ncbi:MAG: Plasma membrane permease, mediates uptake of glycerophosphoinositol and glycerophosphocholine [Alectoria sarmentosa]|nr:MAG: Plasma membrane permease, mediates uptake of glycerophosphoinositol and glycerophosphocholine [Alectoria sarmentosa]
MSDVDQYSDEGANGDSKIPGAPGAVVVAEDPTAPSKEISSKRQSLSDLFTIFCSGFALISDGYQNNLMTMTNVVLKAEYKKQYTSAVSTRVSNALLVGEIIGQLVIGLTCDYLGRKVAIVTTTAMIVIGGILATASHGITINGMFWMMTISRGIVGFGTGGEYPASSTSASEAANEFTLKKRGPIFILVTNLPLSFGGPLAVSVFLIVISAATTKHLSTVWRVTFPNGVFSGTIISSVVKNGSIEKTAEWQLLLGSIAIPGVLIGVWLCDRLGRKNTMMLGFSGYLVFGLIIGCAYDRITKNVPLFVIFYGLMLSSGNLGPGDMLGLVSSESYATAVRGTCYGISAALGKTGAAVGTEVFTPIQTNLGKKWTFIIAAICGVVGVLVTFFFVPNLTGADLAIEDEKFRAYLVAHGWDGEMGEEDLKALADKGIPRSIVEEGGVDVLTRGRKERLPSASSSHLPTKTFVHYQPDLLIAWVCSLSILSSSSTNSLYCRRIMAGNTQSMTSNKESTQAVDRSKLPPTQQETSGKHLSYEEMCFLMHHANYCTDFETLRENFNLQFNTDRSLDAIETALITCKDEEFFTMTEVAESYKKWYTEHPMSPVCPIILLGSRVMRTELRAYIAYHHCQTRDSKQITAQLNIFKKRNQILVSLANFSVRYPWHPEYKPIATVPAGRAARARLNKDKEKAKGYVNNQVATATQQELVNQRTASEEASLAEQSLFDQIFNVFGYPMTGPDIPEMSITVSEKVRHLFTNPAPGLAYEEALAMQSDLFAQSIRAIITTTPGSVASNPTAITNTSHSDRAGRPVLGPQHRPSQAAGRARSASPVNEDIRGKRGAKAERRGSL